MTIKDFHESLKNRKISAREMVAHTLEAVQAKNEQLHAYLEVFESDAYDAARAIDERVASGETPGALWGVPLAIKDNILIKGKHASAGSRILENYTASYDATVIERLRRAGAIFIGRANMDEFAMGSSTENSAYGPTHNPIHPDYVPGGSSGGSAVAVASHMALGALGSDTGGSIRQPAAFCGVVGLKPTYGAVSRSGVMAMASSLDQIGPLGQTVDDVETIYHAIRGHDVLDATSMPDSVHQVPAKKVLTIGVPKEFFIEGLDPRIKSSVESMVKKLSASYDIKEVSLPHMQDALPCYYIIVPAEVSSNMARYDGIRYGVRKSGETITEVYNNTRGSGLGTEVRRRILLGTYVLSHGYYDAYYAQAQKVRSLIKKDFEKALKEVDVIIGPTTPTLPFKIGEKVNDPLAMYLSDIYTIPVNLAGIPGLVVPSGVIPEDGVDFPVGIQLLGRHFAEEQLFEVGRKIEELRS
jgi:aspartyl-tRNA(Asn)/glutamyl-tRNA(Gln) amidotransferase subunit A